MKTRTAIFLSASDHNGPAKESEIRLDALADRGIKVAHYNINTRNLLSGLAFTLYLAARHRPEIVVAFEYYCAFFSCLAFGWRRDTKVIVIGMNQSRRLLRFGIRIVDRVINRIFGQLRLVVVHSKAEKRQFSDLHAIADDRFAFAHWGYDLPSFVPPAAGPEGAPPVCMIGRNNRDYACLIEASALGPFGALIVAPSYSGLPDRPSKEVTALFDIPMQDCIAHMSVAKVNVVALADASRGAGHITLVSAMHLGKPQVVTDVEPVSDYVFHGFNALLVPSGDARMLAEATTRLFENPDLAQRLGENGKALAHVFMSHAAFLDRLNSVVDAVLRGVSFDFVDPRWVAQVSRIRQIQAEFLANAPEGAQTGGSLGLNKP